MATAIRSEVILPLDLIIPIIELLPNSALPADKGPLYSCLFVDRSWSPIVTASIVRFVYLSSAKQVTSFQMLLDSSRAGKYVKELEIGYSKEDNVFNVVKLCTKLEYLTLVEVRCDQASFPFPSTRLAPSKLFRPIDPALTPETLISLSLRLVTLRYISCTFPAVLLPRLRSLKLDKVNAIYHTLSSMEVKTLHKNNRCLPFGSDLPALKDFTFTQSTKRPSDPIFIIWQRDIQSYITPGAALTVLR